MLQIRPQQMEVLRESQVAVFADAMIPYLRSEVPEAVQDATDEQLRAFVSRCVARGREHGIDDSYLLQQFCLFTVWLGEDFENTQSTAAAGAILRDPSLAAEERIAQIEDWILDEWEGTR